jgi:Putative beta-barrel porin 2
LAAKRLVNVSKISYFEMGSAANCMSVKYWQVNRNAKTGGILLATGVLTAQRVLGGSVLMNQPPVVTTPPVVQEDAVNNEMDVFIPSGVVNPDSAGLFQYGPVTLHPHVVNSLIYGSGIQATVGNEQDTLVDTLSPGVTADLGRHWTVDYTPTLNFYSSRQFHNSVDQSASLTGATHYEDWDFNLSQNANISSDPLTETGAQTDQESYSTALSAAYAFNDKWAANASVDQSISLVSELQDSYNWSTLEGVSYEFSPRLNVGISAGGGYTKVSGDATEADSNPDSVNEEIQFNANWRATDKISLQGSVGVNDEQFLAAGFNDSLSPIFSAAIQYQPFKVTQISLSAGRSVGSSDFFIEAQTSDSTTISLSLNQRILKKYNLTLGVGYSQTQYTTTDTITIPSLGLNFSLGNARTDNEYTFNASFGRSFLTHGNWAITYQYSDNESSIAEFSQRSNQIGLQVGFSY